MKILLVHPGFPASFWSFEHAVRLLGKKTLSPPLGLLTVAAMLPLEWEMRVVDLNVTTLSDRDITWADYVLISAIIVQKESAREIIARCNQLGATTVAGGMLFTAEYEDFQTVDHLVLGEAESTLPPFLKDLEQGTAKPIYRSEKFPDLRSTPTPLWDLIDLDDYASMCIQFSRGCPYNCDFCTVTMAYGHKLRMKTSDQIIAELNALYDRGWRRGVLFVDDNFTVNKKVLNDDLLPAIIKWREPRENLPFCTHSTINLADDQPLMQNLTAAGFNQVFIGIETPNEASLAECNKNQNKRRDLLQDVKKIHRNGLQVQAGFIIGFDHDTPETLPRLVDFIQDSGIITATVGLLQAPAGSKLYDRMKEEGRLLGQTGGDSTDGTTNIVPVMGLERLLEEYNQILATIFSTPNFYRRLHTFLGDFEPSEQEASSVDAQYLVPLLRSFFHLGIIGKERLYFWKLLAWTFVRRRKSLAVAISLAVCGYHFRRYYAPRIKKTLRACKARKDWQLLEA